MKTLVHRGSWTVEGWGGTQKSSGPTSRCLNLIAGNWHFPTDMPVVILERLKKKLWFTTWRCSQSQTPSGRWRSFFSRWPPLLPSSWKWRSQRWWAWASIPFSRTAATASSSPPGSYPKSPSSTRGWPLLRSTGKESCLRTSHFELRFGCQSSFCRR